MCFHRQFKSKKLQDQRESDELWVLLARKVALAKAILSLPKRKREEEPRIVMNYQELRSFKI